MTNAAEISEALNEAKGSPAVRRYLFEKLAVAREPEKWFSPLKAEGFLLPEANPLFRPTATGKYEIPRWEVLDYLQNLARHLARRPESQEFHEFRELIDSIATYPESGGGRRENPLTDIYLLKIISEFPIEDIRERLWLIKDFFATRYKLGSLSSELFQALLPKVIAQGDVGTIEVVLRIATDFEAGEKDPSPLVETYYLRDYLEKNFPSVVNLVGEQCVLIAMDAIDKLALHYPYEVEFAKLVPPSGGRQDYEKYEFVNTVLYMASRALCELAEHSARMVLSKIVGKRQGIGYRLALIFVSKHFIAYRNFFWQEIMPCLSIPLPMELFTFFVNCAPSFSAEDVQLALAWIEELQLPNEMRSKENAESRLAFKKKELLFCLRKSESSEVESRYVELDRIVPGKVEHPGEWFWMEEPNESQGIPSFSEMVPGSIVEYLRSFHEEFDGPDATSVGQALAAAIAMAPHNFLAALNDFLSIQREFQYWVIEGFAESARRGEYEGLDDLLSFVTVMLNDQKFWIEQDREEGNNRNGIIIEIARIIDQLSKDDEWIAGPGRIVTIKNILVKILPRTESTVIRTQDILTEVLNSPKGRVLSAVISHCLQVARVERRENVRWDREFRDDFTSRLDRDLDDDLDYSTVVGQYLPQLCYLDFEWVKSNVDKIFFADREEHWYSTMYGYLFFGHTVHENLYKLLLETGNYHRALQFSVKLESLEERTWQSALGIREDSREAKQFTQLLMHHIGIAYLHDLDRLDDPNGLLSIALGKPCETQMLALIRFIGSPASAAAHDFNLKLDVLWERLVSIDASFKTEILRALSWWLDVVDELTPRRTTWLKLSAAAITKDVASYHFLDSLVKRLDSNPVAVEEIFRAMLEGNVVPVYPEGAILKIVASIKSRNSELASEIKNIYFLKGPPSFSQRLDKQFTNGE